MGAALHQGALGADGVALCGGEGGRETVTKSCETADMPEGGSGPLYAHTGAMSEAFGLPDALRICSRGAGDQTCI